MDNCLYQNKMNILYSSDDNYAQHMGVSIYSLLSHNQEIEDISIYVVDNEISMANREKLQIMAQQFANAHLEFVPFAQWKSKLNLNMEWEISLSSYARLFVDGMLPNTVSKVLYVDCDMIICDSLQELWNTNMKDNIVAAVQDAVSMDTKKAVGLKAGEKYFNAGLLLIDLAKWRELKIEDHCLDFIKQHSGKVIHHDQGVLNGIFHGQVCVLPVRYNLMTIHFLLDREKVLKYAREDAKFYSEEELLQAKNNPAILHFTPSFTCRPWVRGCKHPLKQLYWDVLGNTPWAGAVLQRNTTKYYVRLIEWWYRIAWSKF